MYKNQYHTSLSRTPCKLLLMGGSNRVVTVIESMFTGSAMILQNRLLIQLDKKLTLDQMNAVLNPCDENSPYLLANEDAYQEWRRCKLDSRRQSTPLRVFRLNAQGMLAKSQLADLQQQLEAYNFIIFETAHEDFGETEFVALNRQFGLHDIDFDPAADTDRVTALRVVDDSDQRARYIPYTNRAMNWHTDGYYNSHLRRINAFGLYCVNQSARGGGNFLFDHEMMYLLIRDQSPELLEALMHNDLMRIPANVQDNRVVRAEQTGPVFSLQPGSCALNMRYTTRAHNIVWKSDKCSQQALNLVREILLRGEAMVEIRMQAGQGIVCNNILHGREAFQDDPSHPARLVYRARYYDAINFERSFSA